MNNTGKLIVFSAPSGSGKTTIVRELCNFSHQKQNTGLYLEIFDKSESFAQQKGKLISNININSFEMK